MAVRACVGRCQSADEMWHGTLKARPAAEPPTVLVEIDRDVVGITGSVVHRRRMFEGVAVTITRRHSREVLG